MPSGQLGYPGGIIHFRKKGPKYSELTVERLLNVVDSVYTVLVVSAKPSNWSWKDEEDFRAEAKTAHKKVHHLRKMVASKPKSRHTERKFRRAAVRFIKG